MKKTIIFCGGGSGGHVIPAVTLIEHLKIENEFDLFYIGGKKGIEREIIGKLSIPYFPISAGKLRRYLSFQNFLDIFKVILGIFQSLIILLKFNNKSTLVFSTGGFISVPVVIAAFLTRKKIFIHEQTSRIGLANKISSFFASKIFISFHHSKDYLPEGKTIFSGYPLRDECFSNNISPVTIKDRTINNIEKDILFITGGGNGARCINELIKKNINELKKEYFIVHQVGKDFIAEYSQYMDENYLPVDFLSSNIIDLYKIASIIISRSGAGTVSEMIALKKRTIFIPLKIAQKNEQYHNALEAQKELGSAIISEDDLSTIELIKTLQEFKQYKSNKSKSEIPQENPKNFLISEIKNSF